MDYVSTRGSAPHLGFADAMMAGLARDGGLYVPAHLPRWDAAALAALAGQPWEEVAFRVMRPFLGGAIADADFRELIAGTYAGFAHPARTPLVQLAPGHFLLELFHGPTLAFKDVAMQLIGRLFDHELGRRGRAATIVGATSGDTGSAAIEAFRGRDRVAVFILFPEGRVSEVQRRQMTTPAEGNVHALALTGDFDACQARVKDMFNDFAFRDAVSLAGVNSINWARVLAQVVYYFTAAVALGAPHRPVRFTVPTGNFGDIYAGAIARAMGLPIERLVVATNQNDILHRALATGEYRAETVRPSISPSMDIQVASNFERALWDALGHDGAAVAALMAELRETGGFAIPEAARAALASVFASGRASETETRETIARIHAETGLLICPHTAVGVKVAEDQPASAAPMITLATAHPAKFPDAVEQATGVRPALPPHLADLFDRPERVTRVPDDLVAIQTLIRERTLA
jgi:threonine synthase